MLSKRPSRRIVAEPLQVPAPSPDERAAPPSAAPVALPSAPAPVTGADPPPVVADA
jgi:hypothetical protein